MSKNTAEWVDIPTGESDFVKAQKIIELAGFTTTLHKGGKVVIGVDHQLNFTAIRRGRYEDFKGISFSCKDNSDSTKYKRVYCKDHRINLSRIKQVIMELTAFLKAEEAIRQQRQAQAKERQDDLNAYNDAWATRGYCKAPFTDSYEFGSTRLVVSTRTSSLREPKVEIKVVVHNQDQAHALVQSLQNFLQNYPNGNRS